MHSYSNGLRTDMGCKSRLAKQNRILDDIDIPPKYGRKLVLEVAVFK